MEHGSVRYVVRVFASIFLLEALALIWIGGLLFFKFLIFGLILMGLAMPFTLTGLGLWNLEDWARRMSLMLAALWLAITIFIILSLTLVPEYVLSERNAYIFLCVSFVLCFTKIWGLSANKGVQLFFMHRLAKPEAMKNR